MNRHFQPYQSHVVPFTQLGKGNMNIFGGSSPYNQGGNGLGGMFHGPVRTATPFLKFAVTKVSKHLQKMGVDTGMQIVGDVLNRESLKKAATVGTTVAGSEFLTGTFNDLTQQKGNGCSRGYEHKRKAIPTSSTHNKRLNISCQIQDDFH